MQTISRICGVLLGLCVLGSIRPVAWADDEYDRQQAEQAARDRAYQEAQAAREAQDRWDEQQRQWREAQDKAQADREAMDKYWREWQQTLDERAAWYKWQEEQRKWYENEAWQKSYDEWMGRGSADWSAAGSDSTPGRVPVVRPAGLVILNPFALQQMAPEDQEKVRQQATLSGQPIMQESQLIQNPFVVAPK